MNFEYRVSIYITTPLSKNKTQIYCYLHFFTFFSFYAII